MSRTVALGIVVGASLGASVGSAFSSLDSRVRGLQSNLSRVRLGMSLSGDLLQYSRRLEILRRQQAQAGGASEELAARIRAAESAYHRAALRAGRYGIEIGNAVRQHRMFGQALRDTEAQLARVQARQARQQTRSEMQGNMLGMVGSALAAGSTVKASADYERELRLFGNIADLDADKLATLKQELNGVAKATHQAPGELVKNGLGVLVGKGLDVGQAMASLHTIGRAATATGAEMDDLSKTAFTVIDTMGVAPDQLGKSLDILAKAGKMGSFELKDMAKYFPMLTAQAKSLGLQGQQGIATLGSALQVAMKGAGSPEEAARNMENFLVKMTSQETTKNFAKHFNVDLEKEFKAAAAAGKNPFEVMISRIQELTGGDKFRMGELFGDMQVLNFLNPMLQNMDKYKEIKASALAASGVVDKDFANMAGTALEHWKAMTIQATRLGDALASVLFPGLNRVLGAATWVGEVLAGWAEQFPRVTQAMVGIGAGAGSFLVLGWAGKYAWTILRDGAAVLGAVGRWAWGAAAALGGTLVGAVKAVGVALGGLVTRVFPLVVAGLRAIAVAAIANPIGAVVAGIAVGAGLIIAYWDEIKGAALAAWDWLKSAAPSATAAIEDAWVTLGASLSGVWDGVKAAASSAFTWILDQAGIPVSAIESAWSGLGTFFTDLWDGIKSTVGEAVDWMIGKVASIPGVGAIGDAAGWVGDAAKGAWDTTKGAVGSAWDATQGWFGGESDTPPAAAAPALAAAGITAPKGAPSEGVRQPNPGGGGGTFTANISVSAQTSDEKKIAEVCKQQIAEAMRRYDLERRGRTTD